MTNGLEIDGFTIIKGVLDDSLMSHLKNDLEDLLNVNSRGNKGKRLYGVRDLINRSPGIRRFAESPLVQDTAKRSLGARARIVRAIYFDKTPEVNWKVPWHQDMTISVRERIETGGFGPWTRKAGIWHVQPPDDILHKMVTLRFHLDDADETNGALKVVPGSHLNGRLSASQISTIRKANENVVCRVKKGDCLVMSPLLLHSSSAGESPTRRRVIHLEFASIDLPGALYWYGS